MAKASWQIQADSEEAQDLAIHAIDGRTDTHWHSRWQGHAPDPLPHRLTIDLGASTAVGGFRYLPRQDGSANGSFDGFRFYVSEDGRNWGEPVLEGQLSAVANLADARAPLTLRIGPGTRNQAPAIAAAPAPTIRLGTPVDWTLGASDPDGDALQFLATGLPNGLSIDASSGRVSGVPQREGAQAVEFRVADGRGLQALERQPWLVLPARDDTAPRWRHVMVETVDELQGGPWAAVAEIDLLDSHGKPLSREGWRARASSSDTADVPANAIDGARDTYWHSRWQGDAPRHPHQLILDLGRPQAFAAVRLLPRQDASDNGVIGRFRIYTSDDALHWGPPKVEGDFRHYGPPKAEKTVQLLPGPGSIPVAGPRFDPVPDMTSSRGVPVRQGVVARSADGSPVAYEATGLPPGLQLDAGSGRISGTPTLAGRYQPELTATTTRGERSSLVLRWTVLAQAGATHRARFVRLEQLSEVEGRPFGAMAELRLLGPGGSPVPRGAWIVSAAGSEPGHLPSLAIDGLPETFWHARWKHKAGEGVQLYTLDLGRPTAIGGFRYLPRQDGSTQGNFSQFRLRLSDDGENWSAPVIEGRLDEGPSPSAERTVVFP